MERRSRQADRYQGRNGNNHGERAPNVDLIGRTVIDANPDNGGRLILEFFGDIAKPEYQVLRNKGVVIDTSLVETEQTLRLGKDTIVTLGETREPGLLIGATEILGCLVNLVQGTDHTTKQAVATKWLVYIRIPATWAGTDEDLIEM